MGIDHVQSTINSVEDFGNVIQDISWKLAENGIADPFQIAVELAVTTVHMLHSSSFQMPLPAQDEAFKNFLNSMRSHFKAVQARYVEVNGDPKTH